MRRSLGTTEPAWVFEENPKKGEEKSFVPSFFPFSVETLAEEPVPQQFVLKTRAGLLRGNSQKTH